MPDDDQGKLLDRIRRSDTLTNRGDTPEGQLASLIESILFQRVIQRRIDGFTLEASQEITASILSRRSPLPPAGQGGGEKHDLWIAVDAANVPDLATLHVDEASCLQTMDELGSMGFEPRRCTVVISHSPSGGSGSREE